MALNGAVTTPVMFSSPCRESVRVTGPLPCSRTMVLTPWKKPLKRGFAFAWSSMNLTFTVSMGVTAKIASQIPAPVNQTQNRYQHLSIKHRIDTSACQSNTKYIPAPVNQTQNRYQHLSIKHRIDTSTCQSNTT